MQKHNIDHIKKWAAVYYYPERKTAIVGNEILHTHHIVTRVNYITSCLWLQYRIELGLNGKKGFIELPNKPNWLVLNKQFKKEENNRIKQFKHAN